MPTHDAAKLSITEKVGYSFADGAAQFVFLTMVNYQAGFYTDAMGIRAADASWLVLIARLWDAFFDPMMGFLADRTRTRWGRFRREIMFLRRFRTMAAAFPRRPCRESSSLSLPPSQGIEASAWPGSMEL